MRGWSWSSQGESALAGPVGDSCHPAVVLVAAAVEHDGGDAGSLGALGDELADLAGLGRLVTVRGTQVGLEGRRRRERLADAVVDDLGRDVPGGPGHDEAGTSGRTRDLLAKAHVTTLTGNALALADDLESHGYLPAFPTLRRTFSPAYRTPLPLYGSGLRILRMFAATSPTCCLSMPCTEKRVGASTTKVMPSGGLTTTGWLKPSANSRSSPFAVTR